MVSKQTLAPRKTHPLNYTKETTVNKKWQATHKGRSLTFPCVSHSQVPGFVFVSSADSVYKMSLSKPMLKRKNLDITQKKTIIYEYDRLISAGVKVNKDKFAQNHRLARSSLQTLLEPKNRASDEGRRGR